MGAIRNLVDGLANVIANLGTGRDKAASTYYVDEVMSPEELLRMYRNSWLARAIVDYPAKDATRKWRMWRAKADQITRIEAEEKRLNLKKTAQDALVAARLYGGSAIYINTPDADQAQPIKPGADIRSLVVLTPQSLRQEEIIRDINSPYFGQSEFYTLTTGDKAETVRIHASRLAIFRGATVPGDASLTLSQVSNTWADSVLQATIDAVRQIDSTMANIASLVFEAKVDVFKFEGFADMLVNPENDGKLVRRLRDQAAMKGINGAVVIDVKDDYQQKSASFAGLPDVVSKLQDNVSGAAGIPVTRLYGRAAAGLSGSGDGDERVYYDRIGHEQATEIGPTLSILDDCIIWQALGSRPADIFYEWSPLRQMTEAERAEIFSKTATAARAIAGSTAGTEIIPRDALSDALVNELVEQGVLPGLDQAIAKYGSLAEQESFEGDEDGPPANNPPGEDE